MQCHEIDYQVLRADMQIVEIELDPGETVTAEAGAMNYVEQEVEFSAKMGDGSEPQQGIMGKLLSAGSRVLTGESLLCFCAGRSWQPLRRLTAIRLCPE